VNKVVALMGDLKQNNLRWKNKYFFKFSSKILYEYIYALYIIKANKELYGYNLSRKCYRNGYLLADLFLSFGWTSLDVVLSGEVTPACISEIVIWDSLPFPKATSKLVDFLAFLSLMFCTEVPD